MIPVVAVALIDNEQRVLMQQRRIGGTHGGLWEFPGGKVEAAETLQSALLREIEEELGIHLAKDSLKPLSFAATAGHPQQPRIRRRDDPICRRGMIGTI